MTACLQDQLNPQPMLANILHWFGKVYFLQFVYMCIPCFFVHSYVVSVFANCRSFLISDISANISSLPITPHSTSPLKVPLILLSAEKVVLGWWTVSKTDVKPSTIKHAFIEHILLATVCKKYLPLDHLGLNPDVHDIKMIVLHYRGMSELYSDSLTHIREALRR